MTYMEIIQAIRDRSADDCYNEDAIDVFARLQREGKITREDIAQDDFELTASDADINRVLAEVKADSADLLHRR